MPTLRTDVCQIEIRSGGRTYAAVASGEIAKQAGNLAPKTVVTIEGPLELHKWTVDGQTRERLLIRIESLQAEEPRRCPIPKTPLPS